MRARMRGTIKRWAWRALVAALSLVAFAVVASLVARAVVQASLESDLAIATPNGIDDALFVAVNGAEHWITLRGHDRRNPVLFMMHGGPGAGNGPLAPMLRAYEERY